MNPNTVQKRTARAARFSVSFHLRLAGEGKKKSRPSFDDLLDCLWVCDYTARSTLLERKHLVQT